MNFPLSLYIHIPWCIKKCPYCDFNSHALQNELPEQAYIDQLLIDLETQRHFVQDRAIHSVFIGGGTPSLFSAKAYEKLFSSLRNELRFTDDCEITLEANPGTIESDRFKNYFDVGINRVSIGVQSFQNDKLKTLGRIHESDRAKYAVKEAQDAGFKKINIDLMFGLPNQTIEDALFDLQNAVDLSPSHISWYQLTLEPNTFFHRFPPVLPSDDFRFEIQQAGQRFLKENHFGQYEISAYARIEKSTPTPSFQSRESTNFCKHNLNYWLFGDYLGIGAGAHAKLTNLKTLEIIRRNSLKHPKQYLAATKNNIALTKIIEKKELPLEFMMNALRLFQPIEIALFEARTGLTFSVIEKQMKHAVSDDLLNLTQDAFYVTEKGHLFLNELLEIFL